MSEHYVFSSIMYNFTNIYEFIFPFILLIRFGNYCNFNIKDIRNGIVETKWWNIVFYIVYNIVNVILWWKGIEYLDYTIESSILNFGFKMTVLSGIVLVIISPAISIWNQKIFWKGFEFINDFDNSMLEIGCKVNNNKNFILSASYFLFTNALSFSIAISSSVKLGLDVMFLTYLPSFHFMLIISFYNILLNATILRLQLLNRFLEEKFLTNTTDTTENCISLLEKISARFDNLTQSISCLNRYLSFQILMCCIFDLVYSLFTIFGVFSFFLHDFNETTRASLLHNVLWMIFYFQYILTLIILGSKISNEVRFKLIQIYKNC